MGHTRPLSLFGSAHGAGISASAAIDALIRINYILAVAFGDRFHGATVGASAASDARIRNLVCHNKNTSIVLIRFRVFLMIPFYTEKSKSSAARLQVFFCIGGLLVYGSFPANIGQPGIRSYRVSMPYLRDFSTEGDGYRPKMHAD